MVIPEPRCGTVLVGERRDSTGLFSWGGLRVEASLLDPGDLALFADSMNQCLMEASWFMKVWLCRRTDRRFEKPCAGANRSGFDATS